MKRLLLPGVVWVGLLGPLLVQGAREGSGFGPPVLPLFPEGKQVVADCDGDPLPPGAVARLGTKRLRHSGFITSVAFFPDRKVLASAGYDWLIRFWDPATGKELRRLDGIGEPVHQMALSPDGAFLIVVLLNEARSVRLWRVTTGQELPWSASHARARHTPSVSAAAFSPDSRTLATAELDGNIHLWEVPVGKELGQLKGREKSDRGVLAVAFSPDGKVVLSASNRGLLSAWKVGSREVLWRVDTGHRLAGLAVSPDGNTLATAGEQSVCLWKASMGESVRRFDGPRATAVAFAPDGRTLIAGGFDGSVRLLDVTSGRETGKLPGCFGWVRSVAFSPDGKQAAAGGADARVHLWDVASGRELHPAPYPHDGAVGALTFSPDGRTLASAGWGINLWDVRTRQVRRRLEGHTGGVMALAFSADGKVLGSAALDGTRLWEPTTGKPLHQLPGHGPQYRVAFSPDGRVVAYSGGVHDLGVRLADVNSGAVTRVFRRDVTEARRLVFSADGAVLITVGWNKTIQAWSVPTGTEVFHAESNRSYRYGSIVSADGRSLADQEDDGLIHVWELATGQERTAFREKESLRTLTFSPDGAYLAGALTTGPVCVWDLATGREVGRFPGHGCLTECLAYSPDGRTLASGGSDSTILLWDVNALPAPQRAPPHELSPKELDAEWHALGGEDAARAYRALWALRAVPPQALPLLARDLRPAAVDPERVPRLLRQLDSDEFASREKATAELEKLGGEVVPALQEALHAGPSPEAGTRLERLLDRCRRRLYGPDHLRAARMLELAEHIGTPEAERVLQTLADNHSDAWLAQEARATQARLRQHHGGNP